MPKTYSRRILTHLAHQRYAPRTIRELAEDLGISREDFEDFRSTVDQLLDEGQVVLDTADSLILPPPGREMTGTFRGHERGFGFVVPDELTQHGDLFIPPGNTLDAMTGDRVRATVRHERRRGGPGRSPYVGRIVEVIQRSDQQYVGTLARRGRQWLVMPDGRSLHDPVVIRDPHARDAKEGDKVVIELIHYPENRGELAEGVIIEVLGDAGEPEVETLAVMRAYNLAEQFPPEVLTTARAAAQSFSDDKIPEDREDLTDLFICTIDPPDARDFDDAISIRRVGEHESPGSAGEDTPVWELGVHIADVAHFVRPGTPLDDEAYQRGNSSYLPRKVVPMLPELLSNGVCSLQEGVNRYVKSCFIQYDAKGRVVSERFARAVIRSAKRLTYLEAQALIDDDIREARKHTRSEPHYSRQLVQTLKLMNELAQTIRQRRLDEGMIVLGLPEVELVYDDAGRVIDAEPEDNAFTHTIIEMFMVEANEAAARLFDALRLPMIRRIHPDPDAHDITDLRMFARVAGYNIPAQPSRKELQTLLEAVRGKPAQHAVHLAVLKTLSKAEYGPALVGHFALASEHYTHFTSPIRRYPDLVVHRALDAYVAAERELAGRHDASTKPGTRRNKQIARHMTRDNLVPDEDRLHEIGRHCSNTERNSESAERELRTYLVLELLAEHMGEDYHGTVTGVTANGVFVQVDRYLVDGLIRTSELPGGSSERWKLNSNTGALVAQRSGRSITIGDRFTIRIANVDLARRQLDLVIIDGRPGAGMGAKKGKKKGGKRTQPTGARKAHQATMKVKRAKSAVARASKKKRVKKQSATGKRRRR